MGKPATLLEELCGHAFSLGADSIEVEPRNGQDWVFAKIAGEAVRIYRASGKEAQELRGNLDAAARKPIRTLIGGRVYLLRAEAKGGAGGDAFAVRMEPAPKFDPSVAPKFTVKQGQYLAFIHSYTKIHRQAPAEMDLQRYFQVSPPSVHQMILTLELNGLIERIPGKARSIRLRVPPEHLPRLE
jgi:hypothetical protein